MILGWARSYGMQDSVMTVEELSSGDDVRHTGGAGSCWLGGLSTGLLTCTGLQACWLAGLHLYLHPLPMWPCGSTPCVNAGFVAG